MDERIRMGTHWKNFQDKMIPKDASEAQIRDMKSAFWGGAHVTSLLYQVASDLAKEGRVKLAVEVVVTMEKDIEDMIEMLLKGENLDS